MEGFKKLKIKMDSKNESKLKNKKTSTLDE